MIKVFISLLLASHTALTNDKLFKELELLVKSDQIALKGCKLSKDKWLQLVMLGQSFEEKITPNKKCSISAIFKPALNKDFKVTGKVQNSKIKDFSFISKITPELTEKFQLKLEIKKGSLLYEKENITFKGSQLFNIDPMAKSKALTPAAPGELTLGYKNKTHVLLLK